MDGEKIGGNLKQRSHPFKGNSGNEEKLPYITTVTLGPLNRRKWENKRRGEAPICSWYHTSAYNYHRSESASEATVARMLTRQPRESGGSGGSSGLEGSTTAAAGWNFIYASAERRKLIDWARGWKC
jgi:hypothetical protein